MSRQDLFRTALGAALLAAACTAPPPEEGERAIEPVSTPPPSLSAELPETPARGHGEGFLARDEIRKLKSATVLIRVANGSGSGFVFGKTRDGLLVATNHHVVDEAIRPGIAREIVVVFDSGSGGEQRQSGEVLGIDRENDLAVVLVRGGEANQERLPLGSDASIFETLPVVVAGFPFGDLLARSHSPAPTLGTGSVSSLRSDEAGELKLVQLDADVNPGNSGGPVLDGRGQVVGVAVETVLATNIAFMVPVGRLARLVDGFASEVTFKAQPQGKLLELDLTFQIQDPLGSVSRVGINALPAGQEPTEAERKPPFMRMGSEIEAVDKPEGTASLRIVLPVPPRSSVWLQGWYENGQGRHYLAPLRASSSGRTASAPSPPPALPPTRHDWGLHADADRDWQERFAVAGQGRIVRRAPGPIDDVRLAGGGRYLLCRVDRLSSVAVFDLARLDFVHVFRIADSDFIYAGGGRSLVVYLPTSGLLQVYDLERFERLRSGRSPFSGPVMALEMGHSNSRRALVRWEESLPRGARREPWALLDVESLSDLGLPVDQTCRRHSSVQGSYIRVAYELSFALVSGHTVEIVRPTATGFQCRELGLRTGAMAILGGTRSIFLDSKIFSTRVEELRQFPFDNALYPAADGSLYLNVYQGRDEPVPWASVHDAGSHRELATLPAEIDWWQPRHRHMRDALDRRIVFLPWSGVLAVAPPGKDYVEVYGFDFDDIVARAGKSYLVVTSSPPVSARSGQDFSYHVEVASSAGGVGWRLEHGPPGMDLIADGWVRWKVPITQTESADIVVRITDEAGEEVFHAFTLEID